MVGSTQDEAPSPLRADAQVPFAALRPAALILALILAICQGAWLVDWAASFKDGFDELGAPVGIDYAVFWTAATQALDGAAARLYDFDYFDAAQQAAVGRDGFFPWLYPPTLLVALAPFAPAPYVVSYVLWTLAGVAALFAALRFRSQTGATGLLLVATSPGLFFAVLNGQTSMIVAAVLLVGLKLAADGKPVAGGLVLGLLIVKPQFGIALPVVALALRSWRLTFAAGASAAIGVAVSVAAFGVEPWTAYLTEGRAAQSYLLERASGGLLATIPTVFAALRQHAASVGTALLGQAAIALAAAAVLYVAIRAHGLDRQRIAAVALATFLMSPYAMNYDLLVASAALAFAASGARLSRVGWALVAAAHLAPWWALYAALLGAPVAPLVLAGAFLAVAQIGRMRAAGAERLA